MFLTLFAAAHPLVHVNATLNTIATVLLIAALMAIKLNKEHAHKNLMRAALAVSAVFLGCYLYYHYQVGSVKFSQTGVVKTVYLTILASHVLLAMTVPFLALWAAYLGTKGLDPSVAADADFRRRHRRVVRWAYPIWLYVSVTGVVVYAMLYHLYPPEGL